MKLLRLRGRKICDRVLRAGRLWKGRTFMVRWLPGHPSTRFARSGQAPSGFPSGSALYAGTLASTKLDKSAVKRNRMRRRCREALRIALREEDALPAAQLLIIPCSSSLYADFAEIQCDVSAFLSVLRSWQQLPRSDRTSSSSR